jgi:hypothetical protein
LERPKQLPLNQLNHSQRVKRREGDRSGFAAGVCAVSGAIEANAAHQLVAGNYRQKAKSYNRISHQAAVMKIAVLAG